MKKLIIIGAFLISTVLMAQEQGVGNGNSIALGAHIPEQAEGIPATARRMLINKLGQIITKNGVSDTADSRFILVPNITVLSKNITPTAPPKVALNLEVTLYVGDGIEGDLFNSRSFLFKGVGTNETKAYISALRGLNPNNSKVQQFITASKNKVVTYFNENCAKVIKEIDILESQNEFGKALLKLSSIPLSSSCFNKVDSKFKTLYKKMIDKDCKKKLTLATAVWATNQDVNAANKAGALLASIEPSSKCFKGVNTLYTKIAKRVKTITDRPWTVYLQKAEMQKDIIKAARDIGVAYGKNQPRYPFYNIEGWNKHRRGY